MLKKEVLVALNKQINVEFEASYHYLSLSSYYDLMSLKGFAKFFKKQSQEELEHAMKIYGYLMDLGEGVDFLEIKRPKQSFKSVLDGVKSALLAEENNTKNIHDLFALARKAGDVRTESFLKWFVDEQIEEEATMQELVDKVGMVVDESEGILFLDKELSGRE